MSCRCGSGRARLCGGRRRRGEGAAQPERAKVQRTRPKTGVAISACEAGAAEEDVGNTGRRAIRRRALVDARWRASRWPRWPRRCRQRRGGAGWRCDGWCGRPHALCGYRGARGRRDRLRGERRGLRGRARLRGVGGGCAARAEVARRPAELARQPAEAALRRAEVVRRPAEAVTPAEAVLFPAEATRPPAEATRRSAEVARQPAEVAGRACPRPARR